LIPTSPCQLKGEINKLGRAQQSVAEAVGAMAWAVQGKAEGREVKEGA